MSLGETIYNVFGKVYVKNLNRSPDRWDNFKTYADSVGLIYERIPAIDGRGYIKTTTGWFPDIQHNYGAGMPGIIGNHLTCLYILLKAMSEGAETFIMSDDDVEFINMDAGLLGSTTLPFD